MQGEDGWQEEALRWREEAGLGTIPPRRASSRRKDTPRRGSVAQLPPPNTTRPFVLFHGNATGGADGRGGRCHRRSSRGAEEWQGRGRRRHSSCPQLAYALDSRVFRAARPFLAIAMVLVLVLWFVSLFAATSFVIILRFVFIISASTSPLLRLSAIDSRRKH